MSHYHQPGDGFPNLEEIDVEARSDDQSSDSSVLRNPVSTQIADRDCRRFRKEVGTPLSAGYIKLTDEQHIDRLRQMSQSAVISAEVRRYLQHIVVFLRLERGVAGGVSPYATSQFELLTKSVINTSHQ
jgi:hypothetical protein